MIRSTRFRTSAVWLAALAVIATLWISPPAARADSANPWTITEMSGRVNIVRSGAAPVSLTTGDQLRPGDLIETAADSGAILVRNGESIVIAPNSRMGLPSTNDSGFATLILQQFGTLLLKVEKQQRQHFEVKTPYLAAVVKGTTFSVNVDGAGASVHVIEGAVQVTNKTGMSVLVRPGQTALVSSAPGSDLKIKGASTNDAAQRSEVTQDQESESTAQPKVANATPIEALPVATTASPEAFVIEDTVGTLDIDIFTATNGLIQAAQTPDLVGEASTSQGAGSTGAVIGAVSGQSSSGSVSVSTSTASLGTVAVAATAAVSPLGDTVATVVPGGAPVGGSPLGAPVAAGPSAVLAATVSSVETLVPPVTKLTGILGK